MDTGTFETTTEKELKESLGMLFATLSYITSPYAEIKLTRRIMSMERALILKKGLIYEKIDGSNSTYHQIFNDYKEQIRGFISAYNESTLWKEGAENIDDIIDSLYAIAITQNLISINREMVNLSFSNTYGAARPESRGDQ